MLIPSDLTLIAVTGSAYAADETSPHRLNALIREHREPEHLVPPEQFVICGIQKNRFRLAGTFLRVGVKRCTNVHKHLSFELSPDSHIRLQKHWWG